MMATFVRAATLLSRRRRGVSIGTVGPQQLKTCTSPTRSFALGARLVSSNTPPPTETVPPVLSNPSLANDEPVDVGAVAQRLGVRLTQCEQASLKEKLDRNRDDEVTRRDFTVASQQALENRTVRELCLQVIEQPTTGVAKLGTWLIKIMDYVGLALFSVVGTQVAGDAGFNIVGCTLVGCVASLGGRSINNVLYGRSSPLLKALPGVFWARNPMYLVVAIGSSIVTFFLWPVYWEYMSCHYLENVIGKENLEADGSVAEKSFVRACERDKGFLDTIRIGMQPKRKMSELEALSPQELFHLIVLDKSRTIGAGKLKLLVQDRVRNGSEMYAIDTAALASVSVVGVHGAIGMGLHPLVSCTSGITMTLGGILRDVFCGRDIAAASQSYAFATGAGSTVYVLMRELALRGFPIIAPIRIILSMATTTMIRYWEYVRGEPLLAPMHDK